MRLSTIIAMLLWAIIIVFFGVIIYRFRNAVKYYYRRFMSSSEVIDKRFENKLKAEQVEKPQPSNWPFC